MNKKTMESDVERRRDVRFRLQVPLSMEWTDPESGKLSEDTVTQVINNYGCLVSLTSAVQEGLEVTCINRSNQQACGARVICVGSLDADGRRTVGLELLEPGGDFWEK